MAPKVSTKTENKAKAKIIEDKTFGLKNKNKSAKVGKYVQQVEAQVKNAGKNQSAARQEDEERRRREQKKLEEQMKAEMAQITKVAVQQQKVPFGVDPKTVVCAYFKVGQCAKGDKCKFAHDLALERKATKINLYTDARDAGNANATDTMDAWDQGKLEEVVVKKHGPGIRTTTDIVCKHFLEAIESRKYGWFWECPNGGDQCKYRHALPPGFVLKSARAPEKEESETISLEEFLETERYRIAKVTPVTAESFAAWKADRKARATADEKARVRAREVEYRAGRLAGMVSGRDLFVFNPDIFKDDEEAMEVDYSKREEQEVGGEDMVNDASLFLQENLDALELSDEES